MPKLETSAGFSWSSSDWNNNNDIPLMFDKNEATRCGSGGRNGNYNVRTIFIVLPYEIKLENGIFVNGQADRNGVGLINNFQIWTDSSKKTALSNYESIARSNFARKSFTSINPKVKTKTLFFNIWGDGWLGITEIYLYEEEKEAHDALKLKRKQENENANRLFEIKKESFNNQKADYRSWADKPVPDDFKLLMRKAVVSK